MGTYSRTGSHRIDGAHAFFAEHGYVEVPSLVQWMATLQCGRLEIFENHLDPYLRNSRQTTPRCSIMKAGGPWPCVAPDTYLLLKDLNEERWGKGTDRDSREAVEVYPHDHHYADHLRLTFEIIRGTALYKYCGSEVEILGPSQSSNDPDRQVVTIFDTLVADESVTLSFEIKGNVRAQYRYDEDEDALLDDQTGEDDITRIVKVDLSPGQEYTYVELLNVVHTQGTRWLPWDARDWLVGDTIPMSSHAHLNIVITPYENGASLWPAFREMIETGRIPTHDESGSISWGILSAEGLERAALKDIDFWMF